MRFKYAPSSGPIQLAKSIAALNSNVVILSETGDEMTNTLRAAMSAQYDTWSSVNDADNGILSRFPIIESSKGNSYVKAVIDTGYSKVAVYSAHLDWHNYAPYLPRGYGGGALSGVTSEYGWNKIPTGPITDTKIIGAVNRNSDRYSEMNSIINDAKTESQKGREIIIGGDFNEPNGLDWTASTGSKFQHNNVTYDFDTHKLLRDSGYIDTYRSIHPDPITHPGITWPGELNGIPAGDVTEVGADVRDRIDFVYFKPSQQLTLNSAKIVGSKYSTKGSQTVPDNTDDDMISPSGVWYSDHRGEFVTFRIDG